MPIPRVAVLSHRRRFASAILGVLGSDTLAQPVALADPSQLADDGPFDILILDSGIDGAVTLCRALAPRDGLPVIFVAAPVDETWGIDVLCAGARGIVYRRAPLQDVARAVEVVLRGGVWAPRRLVVAAMTHAREDPVSNDAAPSILMQLSLREREVFRCAAAGLGNKELAAQLAISPATVKVHLMHIFRKLG